MNTNLKRYGIGGLLLILGVVIGAFVFSPKKQVHEHTKANTEQTNETIWTCSMHPQIRQDSSGDCPICGMDLIPASQMESEIDPDAIRMSKTARALAKVETTVVGNSNFETNKLNLSGELKVNLDRIENLSANFDGRIERLFVNNIGEQIKKGEIIAEIYAPDLQVLKKEYNLANKQSNSSLIKSIERKIKNLELAPQDISSMNSDILKYKSPVAGFVSMLNVNQGDNIKTGQPILQIADLSNLWASFDIYESALNTIKVGDEININIPNESSVKVQITFISPVLDNKTRSAKARAVLDNRDFRLKPGVFISAELINMRRDSTKNEILRVPRSAVLWSGKRSVVYQELEDESGVYYKMKQVETGKMTNDFVEIFSGLTVGDVIVTHGAFSIDSEAQLADKPSMMNPENLESTKDQASEDIDNMTLRHYLDLKNALVSDDLDKAINVAKDFFRYLEASSKKTEVQNLKPIIEQITKASDIEGLREDFIELSEEIIDWSRSLELEPKLYVQFCPMADSNEGAFWLSLDSRIRNPYFGASMLKCGEVSEIIEPKSSR